MMIDHYDDKTFFKDIKKEGQDYSEDITESFPYVCLKIFWDELSKDNIKDALQGLKTNDESIDAFFVDEPNKEINIIQCKSCLSVKDQKALKKEWLSYLNDAPRKLENQDFIDEHQNPRIREITEDYLKFKNKGFTVKLHFFHLGHADKNSLLPYEETICYYDWASIKEEYQEYLSKLDRTEPPSIEIQLNHNVIEPPVSKQHKTLVSIITGDEIVNLREQYKYKIFDKNLRFGLGKNKINKGIQITAKGQPENFYFYNNGITITSKGFKYKPTNGKLRIEYPQIINGAQTVNAIYETFKEKRNEISRREPNADSQKKAKEAMKKISLLFRVIQDDEKDGKKTSHFEENVTRFNNSQSSIKETDFYANNPEQITLQAMFATFGYFYEIKRGDRKYLETNKEEHNLLKIKKGDFKHWDDKIEIENLASIWMAYQKDPALNKVQKSYIFGHGDKNYDDIFKKTDEITEYQIKEMILAWNLFNLISEQSAIYGSKIKKSQIISKVSKLSDKTPMKDFENIKEIIHNSFLFGRMIKESFETQEAFLKEKDILVNEIKKYHFFSKGHYLTLAIFNLILQECDYKKFLIEDTKLFQNKLSINKYLLQPWLKVILDELLMKEHDDFDKNVGSSLQTFYARNSTWENIQKKLKRLQFDKDKPYKEIFPLDVNGNG